MSIKLAAFLEQLETICALKPEYRSGGSGTDGTCDCIGLIIGAPFGKATLEAMMNSNGEQFDYTIHITPQIYLESALLVLVVSMLVSFFFQKRIKRLDMVEVLKGVE